MKIIVDINHPAHVHYFKNFVWEMEKHSHEVLITASEKDISYNLLDLYGFNYIRLGGYGISLVEKLLKMPVLDLKMYKSVKNFKPDIFVGVSSIRNAHVSKLLGKPCIALDDAEHATWGRMLYLPFTNVVLTPSCFKKDLGKKQIRFNSYIELGYLHPKYFKPDASVLDEMDLSKNETFVLLRFVALNAVHDIDREGFNLDVKRKLIKKLEKYSRVFISSEPSLPEDIEKYKLRIPPDKIHSVLYYAKLFVCDSGTMATEAAILGTPVIRCNSLVGKNDAGNFFELENKYGLLVNIRNPKNAIKKAEEMIQKTNLKRELRDKRERLLEDKCDITKFMVSFIENYHTHA